MIMERSWRNQEQDWLAATSGLKWPRLASNNKAHSPAHCSYVTLKDKVSQISLICNNNETNRMKEEWKNEVKTSKARRDFVRKLCNGENHMVFLIIPDVLLVLILPLPLELSK